MPRREHNPSFKNIVNDFRSWIKSNRKELLEDDLSHMVSVMRNKWNSLVDVHADYLKTKFEEVMADVKSNTYPEIKE